MRQPTHAVVWTDGTSQTHGTAETAWRDEQLQNTQELCLSVPTGTQDERRRLLLYRREWLAWALSALHTLLMQLGLLVQSGPWLSGPWGSIS